MSAPAKGSDDDWYGAVDQAAGMRDQRHPEASDVHIGVLEPERQPQLLRAGSVTLKGSVSLLRNANARRGLL